MKKSALLVISALLSYTNIVQAQIYLRGEAAPCDWGNTNSACVLTDPDNDGIYTLTYNFGAIPLGRREFKIYNANNDSWWPGGANAWFNHQGGSVTFRYHIATNLVEAIEGTTFAICAPGSFSGWNNATPMTNTGGNTWCYTVATPGSYEWKPTYCGSWDSWQPFNGERSVNSSNWAVTTTTPNQQICVTYDLTTGRVSTPPPPTGYYLRGTAGPCGWNNVSNACQLTDPDNNGLFELTINFGTAPIGAQEFKIYHAATDTWYPAGANSWYIHQGGPVTFRIYGTTKETEVKDNWPPEICAPGEFSNWNNSTPMTHQGYGIFCYKVPTPGTYQWKPTVCGSWNSWEQGSGERSVGSANWTVTTTQPNEDVCVTYFPNTGQVSPGAITSIPTMSEWGLILFFLIISALGLVALRQYRLTLAGESQTSSFSLRNLPFDRSAYGQSLVWTAIGFAVIFSTAVLVFGYEMTSADLPGSLLAIPLAAYIIFLIRNDKV